MCVQKVFPEMSLKGSESLKTNLLIVMRHRVLTSGESCVCFPTGKIDRHLD